MISKITFNPGNTHGLKQRRLRRTINREQGRALEMIGHAADYLTDSCLYEGKDDQIIDFRSTSDALQILTSMRSQIMESLPLSEPFFSRVWNHFVRRSRR
jgi:hypothetical protein